MPAYPYLFTFKDAKKAESKGQQALVLPAAYAPNVGQVVVPLPQALEVVDSGQGEF